MVERVRPSVAAGALTLVAFAAGVAGCGGTTRTVTTSGRTVTAPPSSSTTPPAQPSQTQSGPPSTQEAQQYAQRTFVVQSSVGKRVFKLEGPSQSVTASDGSLISAYDIVLADSGDGTGHAVLLFRGTRFLGWASDRLAVRLSLSTAGSAIAVGYGDFQGNDPLCCPSSITTVHYSWDGSRIVPDGKPPLAYGQQGDQLHLAPS